MPSTCARKVRDKKKVLPRQHLQSAITVFTGRGDKPLSVGRAVHRQNRISLDGSRRTAISAHRHLAHQGGAVELAVMIGGQAIRYDVWGNYLRDIDVVVAATAAPHCIITRETLLPLRASRKYRSLFLIDISVPRNISPDVADIDEVYLYDIDTLTQLADEAKRSREQEVSRCEAIIRDSISRYFPDSALYDQ